MLNDVLSEKSIEAMHFMNSECDFISLTHIVFRLRLLHIDAIAMPMTSKNIYDFQ